MTLLSPKGHPTAGPLDSTLTFFRPENPSPSEPFHLLAGQTLASKGVHPAESLPDPGPPLTTKHNAGGRAFKGPIVPPKATGLNP